MESSNQLESSILTNSTASNDSVNQDMPTSSETKETSKKTNPSKADKKVNQENESSDDSDLEYDSDDDFEGEYWEDEVPTFCWDLPYINIGGEDSDSDDDDGDSEHQYQKALSNCAKWKHSLKRSDDGTKISCACGAFHYEDNDSIDNNESVGNEQQG